MSSTGAGKQPSRRDESLRYELRMTLHALACVLRRPSVDAAQVEHLLRSVIDLGGRALRKGSLPVRPFEYLGERPPISAGALLAGCVDPGTSTLAPLLAELDAELLTELDQLVTRAEQERLPAAATFKHQPTDPSEVPLLLEPVDDWSVVARATVRFDMGEVSDPEPTDRALRVSGTALPPAEDFEVERALGLARRLVADIGGPGPLAVRATVDVRGALSASAVAPHTCAVAVALTYLAHRGGLPTPGELGVLPLAGCTTDGAWSWRTGESPALPDLAEDALDLLWRHEVGWTLRTPSGTSSDPDPTLAGAARLLWGDRWEETSREWAQASLDAHRWTLLHATGRAPFKEADDWLCGDRAPLVELDQAAFLAGRFVKWPTSRVIQSGNRNSGKTVCARQLVGALEDGGWQTVVLSPVDRQLPVDDSLTHVVRAALVAAQVTGGCPVLVVLEDLHALTDGNIGAALESLGDLEVGVLALTRYVDGAASNWDSHGVTTYVTPVPQHEVPGLARRLVEAHPTVYQAIDGDAGISAVAEACQGDLGVLTDLLREGITPDGSAGPGQGEATNPVRRQVERACADLDEPARATVCQLAAVSMLDERVPVSWLDPLSEQTRSALGVVEGGGLARIPSEVRAKAVLDFAGPQGRAEQSVWLEPYLLAMVGEGAHERVRALLTNCAAYAPGRFADLLELGTVREALTSWAIVVDPPVALRVLRLCARPGGELLWITAVLPAVITRIRELPNLTARELTAALQALWDHQNQLTGTEVADLLAWLGTPGAGLDAVLARPASVTDRWHLVRSLLRLSSKATTPLATLCEWLEQRADALVRGADARYYGDLIAVRRLDDLIHRRSQEAHGPDNREESRRNRLRPLEKPAQMLLNQFPSQQTSLGGLLAWMSLQLHFNGPDAWEKLTARYDRQIMKALRGADAIQISSAFADLERNDRGRVNQLLNHLLKNLQLGPALAAVLRKSAPAEASILLSTVRNIHGGTIKKLLYHQTASGSQEADLKLAQDLARSIADLKDGRGAGMLLSSVSRADDLYCDTADRFGYRLASELGPEFARALMKRERRPAVIYYFLRGLWEAGADYRAELEDEVLQLVVSSIDAQRGAARPWGPQLAMLLIDDDYFGERFHAQLSARIDTHTLVDRMLNPNLDPQSMVHTHRLALALAPRVAEDYARQIKVDRAVRSPLQWRAGDVAQKLAVMADTLRAAGYPDASRVVLHHFKAQYPEWDWTRSLRALQRIGPFTTALNQLRKVDPGEAASVVHGLGLPEAGQGVSYLRDAVIRSVVHPPLLADLLTVAERCLPGAGRAELDSLYNDKYDRWRTFTDILRYEQDPITQGTIGRQLVRLGVLSTGESQSWMRTLVYQVWAPTMHLLASPKALLEVLTLAYIWEPQWGEQLGERVVANKLFKRLDLRMRQDLRTLPELMTVLCLTGRKDIVDKIVDDLTSIEPVILAETLGLECSGRMLKSLRHADRSVDFLAPAVGQLVGRTLKRSLVVDGGTHWTTLGWTAQALVECGQEHQLPDDVPTLEPNIAAYPAEVAWAAAWLPRTDWAAVAAEEALAAFERLGVTHWHPRESCMALVASARLGLLPADEPLATTCMTATEAGDSLLTLLCREALRTPAVAAHLGTPEVAKRMRERVAEPSLATFVGRQELKSAVERLCPLPEAQAQTMENKLGL
ncbi:hypothetical protein [Streptomyces sp. NPDC056883]|uniref:hypothetical protein n=1 Tax=Streptomyces sp. NPDC056883 TaxID=3345959 RepID=UPI0036CC9DBC